MSLLGQNAHQAIQDRCRPMSVCPVPGMRYNGTSQEAPCLFFVDICPYFSYTITDLAQ